MIPGLPVSSIAQCIYNCHQGACVELFHTTDGFEPTFMEAHQASKMICTVRLLKSQIKTHSFLADIITCSTEVFEDFESDIMVKIRQLCITSPETAKRYLMVKQNADS